MGLLGYGGILSYKNMCIVARIGKHAYGDAPVEPEGGTHVGVAGEVRHDLNLVPEPAKDVRAVRRAQQLLDIDGFACVAMQRGAFDGSEHHAIPTGAKPGARVILSTHVLRTLRNKQNARVKLRSDNILAELEFTPSAVARAGGVSSGVK